MFDIEQVREINNRKIKTKVNIRVTTNGWPTRLNGKHLKFRIPCKRVQKVPYNAAIGINLFPNSVFFSEIF